MAATIHVVRINSRMTSKAQLCPRCGLPVTVIEEADEEPFTTDAIIWVDGAKELDREDRHVCPKVWPKLQPKDRARRDAYAIAIAAPCQKCGASPGEPCWNLQAGLGSVRVYCRWPHDWRGHWGQYQDLYPGR